MLLADEHAILRGGLRLLLERDREFEVAGEASDGREAVDWMSRHYAAVVVMDVAMPGLNGIEAAARRSCSGGRVPCRDAQHAQR